MTTHLFRPSAAHPETAWLRTPPAAGARDVGVDRKREIIHGAVIAQQGNVTGHDFEFDADALSTLHKLMAANVQGLKSRLGHPGLSSNGDPANFLGRYRDFTLEEFSPSAEQRAASQHSAKLERWLQIRGDLHLDPTAHDIPGKGDVADYLLSRIESDPASVMNSIVMRHDIIFLMDHDGRPATAPDEKPLRGLSRPKAVSEIDVVDKGAATRGMLSGDAQLAADATSTLDELLATGYEVTNWIAFLERYGSSRPQYAEQLASIIAALMSLESVPQSISAGSARQVTIHTEEVTAMSEKQTATPDLPTGDELSAWQKVQKFLGLGEKSPEQSPQPPAANPAEALEALESAFPDHPDFARAEWKAGHTPEQARSAHYAVLAAEISQSRIMIETLRQQLQAAAAEKAELQKLVGTTGAKPLAVIETDGPGGDPEGEYLAKVDELRGAGDPNPRRTIAGQFPAVQAAYLRFKSGRR